MTKLAAHVTVISLALAGSAIAADMRAPAYKAPGPAPIATSWTGCYLGACGGYGLFSQETQYLNPGPVGVSTDNGGHGWFGTVQVGCDYQAGSNWVIGAFADYNFGGPKGDMSILVPGWAGEEKLKHSWAAGGRVGWLPFQQLLVFVSGGYTQAQFGQVDLTNNGGTLIGLHVPKHTYSGWFVGSGYEYGIGWLPGLFWKSEYRFADYSADTLPLIVTATGAANGDAIHASKYVHTVRSELVWRFGAR